MAHSNSPLSTYLALFLAILFWGLSFIATKVALTCFPPFTLIFLRFAAASLFFLVLLTRTGFPPLHRRNLRAFALLALFQPGLYFTFETFGLKYTTATKTSLIIAIIPLVVLLLSAILLRERIRLVQLVSILISLTGVGLLVFGGERVPAAEMSAMLLGDLLIFGAVFSAAVYMVIARHLGQTITPLQVTGMQVLFGALLFFPPFLADLPHLTLAAITREALLALVGLTVFATIAAFLCYNFALSRIPATSAAIGLNGIPVVTAVGAWFLLGESLAPLQFLGGATVLTAVFLANSRPRRPAVTEPLGDTTVEMAPDPER